MALLDKEINSFYTYLGKMDKRQFEHLAKSLQHMTSCPNCGAGYALKDIRYFGQLGTTIFVQLNCHNCHAASFAGIPLGATWDNGFPPNSSEASQSPVTYDDAFEANKLLKERDIDFRQLF